LSSDKKKSTNNDNNVSLRVAEAEQSDVGRKIARVEPEITNQLQLSAGDALEISSMGKKTTVLSWPAREKDTGKGLVTIDGHLRNRLDVGINDSVEIKKVQSKNALNVTLAPTEPLLP
jgi:transitional endoplasmic reticulum ATPase